MRFKSGCDRLQFRAHRRVDRDACNLLLGASGARCRDALRFLAHLNGFVVADLVQAAVRDKRKELRAIREDVGAGLPELYELRSLCGRMQTNLPLVSTPTSTKTITVGGGNLYAIAAQQYGDAQRWTDIASANGLSDPMLTGINTLIIP